MKLNTNTIKCKRVFRAPVGMAKPTNRSFSQWFGVEKERQQRINECGGGYGCDTNTDEGNVAVAKRWTEFIGTNHALRNHPNGQKVSVWAEGFNRFDDAFEREPRFFNNWIPTGAYNDLIDVVNTVIAENTWDVTGDLTIQQQYEIFEPDVDFMCEYMHCVRRRYPALNPNYVNEIFERCR